VKAFLDSCLCCGKTKTGLKVPRPYGRSVSGTAPGAVVHMDYLYISQPSKKGTHEYKYILVLKDDFSQWVELIPCRTCDAAEAVKALLYWEARFRVIDVVVTDRGSHFKNNVMEQWVKAHRGADKAGEHHFTFAYSPWANGTVERVNRTILELFRMMKMDWEIPEYEWPFILPHVMSVINRSPSVGLAGYAPIQIFMGLPRYNPLNVIYNEKDVAELPEATERIKKHYEKTIQDLGNMHKQVGARQSVIAKRSKDLYPDSQYGVDFDIGDFVLLAVPIRDGKLIAVWRGPYRVIRALSSHIYEVEHMLSKVRMESHIARLKFFCYSDLDETVVKEMSQFATHQDSKNLEFIPEEVIDYRVIDKNHMVKVKWTGFDMLEATWEHIAEIYQSHPSLVNQFAENTTPLLSAAMMKQIQTLSLE
jgi:hypothetical protein